MKRRWFTCKFLLMSLTITSHRRGGGGGGRGFKKIYLKSIVSA